MRPAQNCLRQEVVDRSCMHFIAYRATGRQVRARTQKHKPEQ